MLHESEAQMSLAAGRKLLIVDDEEKICRMLAQYFSLKGFEVRSVQRGDEAIALAAVFQPHIVLLDLLMPGLNGAETLKQLRQLSPAPRVVMMSAANHEDVGKGALTLGADFYLSKPLDLSKLDFLISGLCPGATSSS